MTGLSTTVQQLATKHLSLLKFLIVGGLSLAADTGALYLFHGVLRIWLPVATASAYGVAFVVNFSLIRIWVFESAGAVMRQLRRYIVLVGVNLALTVVFVQALTWAGLQYLVAKLAVAAVLAVMNFFVSRRWIF